MAKNTALVQIYDGTTNPKEFQRNYMILSVLNEWDDAKQIAHISLFLKAKALRLYTALVTKTTVKHVFDELILKCSDSSETLLLKFYARKRQPDESYATFASALQEILAQAMPGVELAGQASILRAQLICKVPPHVQELINFNKKFTWDEIVDALESTYPSGHGANPLTDGNYADALIDVKREPVDTHYMNSQINRTNSRGGGGMSTSRFNGNCHYCKIYGHRKTDCMKFAAAQQYRPNNSFVESTQQYRPNNSFGDPRFNSTINDSFNSSRQPPFNRSDNYFSSRQDQVRRPSNYTSQSPVYPNNNSQHQTSYSQFSEKSNPKLDENSFSHSNGRKKSSITFNNMESEFIEDSENVQTNYIMVDSDRHTYASIGDNEFPFQAQSFMHDAVVNATLGNAHLTSLLRINAAFTLGTHDTRVACALIDGGSTHSFISPQVLSDAQLHELSLNKSCLFAYSITSATGVENDWCYRIIANLGLGSWSGNHEFVVSNKVSKNNMVLGRDFLKSRKVVVDHGNDTLKLGDLTIFIHNINMAREPGRPSNSLGVGDLKSGQFSAQSSFVNQASSFDLPFRDLSGKERNLLN